MTALKHFEYVIWGGVFVPRGTPEQVAGRLAVATNAALRDVDYRKSVEASEAMVPSALTVEQASRFYLAETERYLRIAKAIKLEPQ